MDSSDEELARLLQLQEQVLDDIKVSGKRFAAGDRLSRDDIHDRDALR